MDDLIESEGGVSYRVGRLERHEEVVTSTVDTLVGRVGKIEEQIRTVARLGAESNRLNGESAAALEQMIRELELRIDVTFKTIWDRLAELETRVDAGYAADVSTAKDVETLRLAEMLPARDHGEPVEQPVTEHAARRAQRLTELLADIHAAAGRDGPGGVWLDPDDLRILSDYLDGLDPHCGVDGRDDHPVPDPDGV